MPRIVWKGAIAFGLVHVPVVLHPGSRRSGLDFDWLDKRDMAPVGYQRINKATGKALDSEFIVKGYQYEKGEYVLMNDEDFRQANPTATQTVEIVCFVKAQELPPYYFETPYYLVPDKRGDKGYVLLRETLRKSGLIGIANVVLHTKQHLAAVLPVGGLLLLNTMRYADEVIPADDLKEPPATLEEAGVSRRELEMAERLVADMTERWQPQRFHDTYREDLLARIEQRIDSGQTHSMTEPSQDTGERPRAKVIDLMSMLKQSIETRAGGKPAQGAGKARAKADAPAPRKAAAKTTARKSAAKAPAKAAKKAAKKATRAAPSSKRAGKPTTSRRKAA
ncbi:Ku protein [Verticiella sediminum]|uniref:Non-homologous end joining protein Ku n=1 Tax=Verticiella sediminum TaxID=1247510 RepID=A0A556AB72_9BURK|nr:Ku protein [Verticiella sediminum]TSH90117.1 Ku protein [Verticiella sediminum]